MQPLLLPNSARMQGFIVSDFAEGREQLTQWFSAGKLNYAENIVEGFDNTPSAFLGLFEGDNTGKQLVKAGEVE